MSSLEALRELMNKQGLDGFIIPSSDEHISEYVAEHFKGRAHFSGFTGSAGTLVVLKSGGGLWTDGRYHVQASRQLAGSGFTLHKFTLPGVPSYYEWIAENVTGRIGVNNRCLSVADREKINHAWKGRQCTLVDAGDLPGEAWKDRPALPGDPVFIHEDRYAGRSCRDKLEDVRRAMRQTGTDVFLLSSLDDIAWLFNLRGSDIPRNPVFLSHAVIKQDSAVIYLDPGKADETVCSQLTRDCVSIRGYSAFYTDAAEIREQSVFYDPDRINAAVEDCLDRSCRIIRGINFTSLLKAVKNTVEISNLRECQRRDGAGMVRFLKWLEQAVPEENITEIAAEEKLEAFRRELDFYVCPSFETTSAFEANGAMMHYKASEENRTVLKPHGFYLIDSGGQYYDGTTDITRTVAFGPVDEQRRRDYTLALKGHIDLCMASFLKGTTGTQLDILARRPLWNAGIDYKCGTGHGVGTFLNVHEGPQRLINTPANTILLEPGMVLTNEPGVYKEGRYGIRIENTLLVVPDQISEFGEFYKFETVSLCPVDTRPIDPELLGPEGVRWLNSYHDRVFTELAPLLNDVTTDWLREKTRAI